MVKYSASAKDGDKAAKAMGVDLRTSFKNTYNVAQAIKGMGLAQAIKLMEDVLDKKRVIPFRRFCSGVGRSAQGKEWKHTQGRWPEKSVKVVLGLLKNAESNAEFKNLETENLVIKHAQVNRARCGNRRTYRAHGRINRYMSHPCHVEMILEEKEEDVAQSADSTIVKFTKKQLAKARLTAAN